ncbi:MAG: MFS transporter [Rhodospirillales bacterium]|nr:MFS transporter [Rhodospirillales bacterium]
MQDSVSNAVPAAAPGAVPAAGPRRWVMLAVLLAGGFLPPVDFFIVNVALPSIQHGLRASPAEVQLVISGYAAAYAVFLVTGGRLGDLYGRRRMFILAMLGFTATSALAGLAASAGLLVLARVGEGLAAALLAPQVLGAIRALHDAPGQEAALARALSLYGAMMGLAAATGQLGGGVLVAWSPLGLGWRAVFLVNLPIGALAIAGAWAFLPETSAEVRPRLDLGGAALLSAALAALVLPLSEGRGQGWPPWTFAMLAAAPFLLWAFLRHEDRVGPRGGMPLLDLELLRIPGFRRGVLVASLFFFTSPFYLLFAIERQDGAGLDPLHTGLAILPYGIGLFLGPLASAPLLARYRPRLLAAGMAVEVAGYAAIGIAVATGVSPAVLAAAVFVAGFGQGIAMPRLFNLVLADVPARQGGVAAGVVNSMLQIGAAVSVAAIGSLFFAILDAQTGPAAYAHAFGAAMIAVVAALALAALLARG